MSELSGLLKKTISAPLLIDLGRLRLACQSFGETGQPFSTLSDKSGVLVGKSFDSDRTVGLRLIDEAGLLVANTFGVVTGIYRFADWSVTTPTSRYIGEISPVRFLREYDTRLPRSNSFNRMARAFLVPNERRGTARLNVTRLASELIELTTSEEVTGFEIRGLKPLTDILTTTVVALAKAWGAN